MVLLEKCKRSLNLQALQETTQSEDGDTTLDQSDQCTNEAVGPEIQVHNQNEKELYLEKRKLHRQTSEQSYQLTRMISEDAQSQRSGGSLSGFNISLEEIPGKKHTLYNVHTTVGSKTVVHQKKFSDFQQLVDKVKKLEPNSDVVTVKLPGKRFFSNRDPVFLAHRLEVLHELLDKIAADSIVLTLPPVQHFLGLSSHGKLISTQCSEDSDEASINGDQQVDLGPSEKPHVSPSDFEFLQVIGKGSFGKVFLAKHRNETVLYAVKVVSKSQVVKKNETRHIMSERNVLVQNIKHPFLIGLHYSFQTQDKLYFVLDYVNGGELFYHLQREGTFEEVRARFYAAEIASALGYLHSLNIIYRDLKPENILLDQQGHVVLTDFGLCKEDMVGKKTTGTFCGTPEYLAPEVLQKQPYDKLVDWWCLGAVLYEMIFGLPPFYCRDVHEMYGKILNSPLTFKTNASTAVKNFLQKLLSKERIHRLGYHDDAEEVKQHLFFQSINWEMLEERKIKPPYCPGVTGPFDLSHFDPEFTADPVSASIGRSVSSPNFAIYQLTSSEKNPFEGFSYVPQPETSYHF